MNRYHVNLSIKKFRNEGFSVEEGHACFLFMSMTDFVVFVDFQCTFYFQKENCGKQSILLGS